LSAPGTKNNRSTAFAKFIQEVFGEGTEASAQKLRHFKILANNYQAATKNEKERIKEELLLDIRTLEAQRMSKAFVDRGLDIEIKKADLGKETLIGD